MNYARFTIKLVSPVVSTIFLISATFPQSAISVSKSSLIGKVVEETSQMPLQSANVSLFNANDGSQVMGTSTDENGFFYLLNVYSGDYYLQVDFIGFETLKTKPFSTKKEKLDIGVLNLKVSPIVMGNVEITAGKSMYDNSIDRKNYNVEKDIANQNSSASDLLQNIPSVSIDIDGNISLRGSANVVIFINGKPSLLMRKNSAATLQQMPANGIKRIEVITNPSAKYKPEGVGGIINIVLRKESGTGSNSTIIANVGNMDQYNASTAMNYHPGRLNLYGSYGLRRTNNPRIFADSRINRDSLSQVISYYEYNSSSSVKPIAHIANLGLDYSINDKNRIGLSGDLFYQKSYHTQTSQTIFRDAAGQIAADFITDRTNDEYENEWEVNSSFEHDFKREDHTLQFELNYSGYNEKEDNFYDETYTAPGLFDALSHNLIRKGGYLAEFYAEYVFPVGEDTQLEAGYVGEFLWDDIRYLGQDYNAPKNEWITDDNKTNRFLFSRDIHALYVTFEHTIEDFSFLTGLRAEQALIKSNLVTSDTTINNNYFKIYPSLHLTYSVDESQQIQLNYSHRVNRPDSDEHNPFAEYTDPRNMEAGNPKIKPEQIHSVEFGYHLKNNHFSVLPSIYYRYKYDAFTEIHEFVNDSTLLRYYTNLANDQSAGLEFILTGNVTEDLALNFSSNTFYYVIDAANLGYSENKSTVSWNAKLAATLNLYESNIIQINAHYRSARLTPQGETRPLFLMNLGLRQSFFKKKLSLTLTVSDVFNSLKWTRLIDTPILYQGTTSKRNSQIIYLGFVWHFGNSSKKEEFNFEDKI